MYRASCVHILPSVGGLTHSWIRYFCQFNKSQDVQFLRLIPVGQHNKVCKQINMYTAHNVHIRTCFQPEFYQVKQCTRCKSDETDRKYCIEVEMYINRYRMPFSIHRSDVGVGCV